MRFLAAFVAAYCAFAGGPATKDLRVARELVQANAGKAAGAKTAPRLADGCPLASLAIGDVMEGVLVSSDCSLRDFVEFGKVTSRADGFKLDVKEELIVSIDITASEFEPDVYVLGAFGQVLAYDITPAADRHATAYIHLIPGVYTVVASSTSIATGTYTIAVKGEIPRRCVVRQISTGQEVEGSFDQNDCRAIDLYPGMTDLRPLDILEFRVGERKVVNAVYDSAIAGIIAIGSDDVGLLSVSGDDAVAMASVNPGVYQVVVTPVELRSGGYKLTVRLSDLIPCIDGSINVGEIVNGSLTDTDCRSLDFFVPGSDSSRNDIWKFEVKDSPALVTLTQRSSEFDTFLEVIDRNFEVLEYNDDFELATADSQVKMSLAPGTYRALASTADYSGGAYTLKYESEPLRSCSAPDLVEGTTEGALTADDCRVLDWFVPSSDTSTMDVYRFSIASKSVYSFDVTATGFSPEASIYDKDGQRTQTEVGDSTEPRVQFNRLLYPGEYRFSVGSWRGAGAYRLTSSSRPPKACDFAGDLPLNGAVEGKLEAEDCNATEVIPLGVTAAPADLWRLEVKERRTIQIELSSANLHFPWIVLFGADGKAIPSSSSRLQVTLTPGVYTVAITTGFNELGSYSLSTKGAQMENVQPSFN